MTALDKALPQFLRAMLDCLPPKEREGVEELRRLAYEDLDRALLLGVETTIQEMRDRRLPIHTNTLRARDWLREHGTKTEE